MNAAHEGWGVRAAQRERAVKQAQGWRCAGCGAQAGGRDKAGHIVRLAVHGGVALCANCRRAQS